MARSKLTPQQQKFVDGIEMGLKPTQAAKAAGYSKPPQAAHQQMQKAPVKAALDTIHQRTRKNLRMTREKVEGGIMRAIEMAELQADPQSMIRGYAEINRMCGFYAPEQKEVKLSTNARRAKTQFESMPEEELLKILSSDDVIDGEFEEVEDDG